MGFEMGRSEVQERVVESAKELGKAVNEKARLNSKLEQALGNFGETVTCDNAKEYLDKLTAVASELENEEAKTILEKLVGEMQALVLAYDTQDDGQIAESYTSAKQAAEQASRELTEFYNKQIETATNKLMEN